MTIQHLQFLSREDAEAANPQPDIAVISITDPTGRAKLRPGWHSILRVEFYDIDPGQIERPSLRADVVGRYPPITEQQARAVVMFIRRALASGATGLLVHCEQGVSRSAAVAKWVAARYGSPLSEQATLLHNRYVYRMLEEAASGTA